MAKPGKRRARPSALVRAEHDEKPVHLTPPQRTLLQEALRRGEDLRAAVESAVVSYGRWMLGEIFGGDTKAALDDKSDNRVWTELIRRAGGPTLQIERSTLYATLRVAALDKRLNDAIWQDLGFGRKRLLLPLATDARLREGAHQVAKFNLTHSAIKQYVAETLGASGATPAVRLTVPSLVSRVHKLRTTLGSAAALRKVAELRDSADAKDRARAAAELDQLRAVLAKVARTLRGKN